MYVPMITAGKPVSAYSPNGFQAALASPFGRPSAAVISPPTALWMPPHSAYFSRSQVVPYASILAPLPEKVKGFFQKIACNAKQRIGWPCARKLGENRKSFLTETDIEIDGKSDIIRKKVRIHAIFEVKNRVMYRRITWFCNFFVENIGTCGIIKTSPIVNERCAGAHLCSCLPLFCAREVSDSPAAYSLRRLEKGGLSVE